MRPALQACLYAITFIRADLAAAAQADGLKGTELGQYYFSVAILRHFLEALRSNDTSTAAIALSKRLVRLTERGRAMPPARHARSVAAAA